MPVQLPAFDVAALRDNAENFATPPADPVELDRQWRALIEDHLAAANHIEALELALGAAE